MGAALKMIGSSHLPRLKNKLRRRPSKKSEGSSSSLSTRPSICDSFKSSGAKPSKSSEGSSRSLSTRFSTSDPFLNHDEEYEGIQNQDNQFSISDSFLNYGAEYEGVQTRGDRLVLLKVFVPDELGPGQEVKVRGPDGRKFRAVIPPRYQWSFQNCDGEPRPFFLIKSVEPTAAATRTPRWKETCRPASVPNLRDTPGMVCRCVVSEGVYDSFCPIHGTS